MHQQIGPGKSTVIVFFLLALTYHPAHAGIIFQDNFDTENSSNGVLIYNTFTQWNVLGVGGSVDLVGNGFFDFLPGNGLYVDLDGTTGGVPGRLETKMTFAPGKYLVKFDLGGNNSTAPGASTIDSVSVSFGSFFEIFTRQKQDPFLTVSRVIELQAPAQLSFLDAGGESIGILLDRVLIDDNPPLPVLPEPSTLLLLGAMGGALVFRRRRSSRLPVLCSRVDAYLASN